jgi:DNA-directed RNA polymerase subunit RPC12/RpoP
VKLEQRKDLTMSKQADDLRSEQAKAKQPIEVKAPSDGLDCPECGHWPLIQSYYDGGDPPVFDPYVYYECSVCGYNSVQDG